MMSSRSAFAAMLFVPLFALAASAAQTPADAATPAGEAKASFGDDVAFLHKHQRLVILKSADGAAQVAVAPGYQGRVMTSTATGEEGLSFGWINRELIASGELRPHINAFGGEDRLWLGPEGGPYALFFAPGVPEQTLRYWQTPPVLDTEAWQVETVTGDVVTLSTRAVLTNRHGTELDIAFTRTVRLLDRSAVERVLGTAPPARVAMVAFESDNRIQNAGRRAWTRESGLPSIWILGMFTPGPKTTVVIPLQKQTSVEGAGPPMRSDYFGEVGTDRLHVRDGTVFFRADGQYRSKLGIPPSHATAFAGSWDAEHGVLTLVNFDLPADAAERPYVDSRWIDMAEPYAGDVLNAYNDGPPGPGEPPLGPFYEIESSSPAAELAPGAELRHRHRTLHFQGPREALNELSRRTLGVSLEAIETAFEN